MSVSELSTSSQNYLKAIWSLGEWSNEPVTASIVAARVGVKLSTVSDAVRKLTDQGLLEHAPYGAISLSDRGRVHAVAMVRRHRLLETFLVQILGYRWDQVHDEAEILEHAVSDFMMSCIDERLGFPTRDPHGDPIPNADGTVSRPDAVLLSELEPGSRGRVERISDADPQLLQFFAQNNMGIGTILTTQPGSPYSEVLEVFVGETGESVPLGRAATTAMWVSPLR